MIERLLAVRRTLTGSAADTLPERLAEALHKEYALTRAELLLVDYRLATLLPVTGGEPVTGAGEPPWHCFDHQSEVIEGTDLFLPVTSRGERIGVLCCSPAPDDIDVRGELAEVATLVAHELQAAAAGTDRYRVAARTRRLTLAAEMQWELLPGRSRSGPAYSLAGQLEPSYSVNGDSFDWAEHDGRLYLSVLNGMGEGVSASLLTALATQALRNARRAGIPLADQVALADQALFAEHRGEQHVSALLLELDLASGSLTVIDAGSPRMLLLRDGSVEDLPLEAQFPLGMFEGSDYVAQKFPLRTADRLFIVSDGVAEAAAAAGRYGNAALTRFVRRTRVMAPLQAVRSLLGDLRSFLGSGELEDDAVAVCLDWTGIV
ncbi:PP2C family protein-serine/threonine phosphatase [Actinoplanes sp. NPDC051411]|uniref:PP2C family protein-serine/threonine phosphatase n=1 Tax=Actinoplanes sp. NPDC051411 TaxID=3155522 RepID=UPI0034428E44